MLELTSKPSVAILHYSAPPVIGGVEAVIQAHSNVFVDFGYLPTVIAGRGDRSGLPEGVEFILIPEIDSRHPVLSEVNSTLEKGELPSGFDAHVEEIENLLEPIFSQYDYILAHNIFTKHFNLPLTAALFRLLDRQVIRNCIAWCHDISWTSPNSRSKVHHGYPWDLLRTYRTDLTYVVVSGQRKAELVDLLGCPAEQVHIIYNGVDPYEQLGISTEGRRLVERLDLLSHDPLLLMPVRVTRAKNIEFAYQILVALKKRGVHPKLVLTGPPDPHDVDSQEYFDELRDLRARLGIEREFSFVFESGEEPGEGYTIGSTIIGDLFRFCDVMLLPSHREGFGMPVLEAGLAGVLAVSTHVPAAVEIGKEDVIQITVDDDPESVSDTILTQLEANPVLRFKRRTRRNYTWSAIFQNQIEPLFSVE
jgi:mannosylglucosylglycerate synthase